MDRFGKSNYRLTVPRAYGENSPTKDPVHYYNKFVKPCPDEMMDVESPMYLTPIPTSRLKPNQKLGKNTAKENCYYSFNTELNLIS